MRRFFADESVHRIAVCRGMFAVVTSIEDRTPYANAIEFIGSIRCRGGQIQSRILNKILRVFLRLIPCYYRMGSEELHLLRRISHERFLHAVANTVLCAVYLESPMLILFKNQSSRELDLTVLPRWIQRIIEKITVKPDYSLVCKYRPYSHIMPED